MSSEVIQGKPQKLIDLRQWRLALGNQLDEFAEIRSRQNPRIGSAKGEAGLIEMHFLQQVKVGFPAPHEDNLASNKQIQPAGKGRFWPERPLGHGLKQSALGRTPVDDEARLCEAVAVDKDGGGLVQSGARGDFST